MSLRFGFGLVCVLVLQSCDTSVPRASTPPAEVPAAAPAASSPRQSPPLSDRLTRPPADVVIAIGDLHGDLAVTRRALHLAGVIDEQDRWIGGERVVVQTGDAIDRGAEDREVLDLLARLEGEARQAGGALIALCGNHELMNVAGDFRYVSPEGFAEFEREGGRRALFRPGGRYAGMLAERPMLIKVGDTVFVHGGILSKHVTYGLDRMQDEVRTWMLGERAQPPDAAVGEDGPVWTRLYSGSQPDCEQLGQVLDALGAKRMVVGHTVQPGGINAACDGRVWRIDVGMSRFYGGPLQVLELKAGLANVLQASP